MENKYNYKTVGESTQFYKMEYLGFNFFNYDPKEFEIICKITKSKNKPVRVQNWVHNQGDIPTQFDDWGKTINILHNRLYKKISKIKFKREFTANFITNTKSKNNDLIYKINRLKEFFNFILQDIKMRNKPINTE